jgi:hypothetical protein
MFMPDRESSGDSGLRTSLVNGGWHLLSPSKFAIDCATSGLDEKHGQ